MTNIDLARKILRGIDFTETDHPDGWWETSTGAEFGSKKLAEIEDLISNTEKLAQSVIEQDNGVDVVWTAEEITLLKREVSENAKAEQREEDAKIADRWAETYKKFQPAEIQDIARVDVCEAIANEIRKLT